MKLAVDEERIPGRLILTGSAHALFVPELSDSLSGRMAILRLHPLAEVEIEGTNHSFVAELLEGPPRTIVTSRLGEDLLERIISGGYPAALGRRTLGRRLAWYRDYITTQIQRDLLDLTHIRSLDVLPRLLAAIASRTSQTLNVAALSSPFEVSRQSIHDYLALLEHVFLVERLPPWHSNLSSPLVKRPKLHIGDTGIASSLLGIDIRTLRASGDVYGALLETFVYQELRRQASWQGFPVDFFYFRDRDGYEVDIVLEHGHLRVAGIEVKAESTVRASDFKESRKLKALAGKRFAGGVVLYEGSSVIKFDEELLAVPIRYLWEKM